VDHAAQDAIGTAAGARVSGVWPFLHGSFAIATASHREHGAPGFAEASSVADGIFIERPTVLPSKCGACRPSCFDNLLTTPCKP
jgi:hypothetical protein